MFTQFVWHDAQQVVQL